MTQPASSLGHLQDGPTARNPTYRLIQVLRAVAALMVVLHHATITLSDRLGLPHHGLNWVSGASGVDIFFVISGFVMALSSAPLFNAPHGTRIFLARRLERIVPLYWLLTLVKLALVLGIPSAAVNGTGGTWHVLSSFLFLPSMDVSHAFEPLLIVGWTLNLEMMFYAIFAVALLLRKPPAAIVAPMLLALIVIGRTWPSVPTMFYGNPIVLEFLFGILLAMALPLVRRTPAWAAALLLCAAFYPLLTFRAWYPWQVIQWGVPALAVVWAALALEPWLGPRTPRSALELGDASYSIYLVHGFALPLVAEALAHMGTHWPGAYVAAMLACVTGSIVLSEVVYIFIERPITEWFKDRRRTAVPAVV